MSDMSIKNIIEKQFDMCAVEVYRADSDAHVPIVYSMEYEEVGAALISECEKLAAPPFHLVTVSQIDWDASMSPWPSEKVLSDEDDFKGQADDFLRYVIDEVLPCAEGELGISGDGDNRDVCRVLSGYSMAGLFALYASYQATPFHRFVSASGSLWYPRFVDYALTHEFERLPECVYLSLGDRESRTSNETMRKVEDATRTIADELKKRGVPSIFELNKGNHFKQTTLREAKGITWALSLQ